jgi:hypothetical protein
MSALEAAAAAAKAQMNATPATDIKFCAIDEPASDARRANPSKNDARDRREKSPGARRFDVYEQHNFVAM